MTKVICVNLAAVGAFLAQGIRPNTWWESHRAARSTRIAVTVWGALLAVLIVLIVIAEVR